MFNFISRRRRVGLAVVGLAVGALAGLTGSAASARGTTLVCDSAFHLTVDPGLTNNAHWQVVMIEGRLTRCTGGLGVSSATIHGFVSDSAASCDSFRAAGWADVKWDNGTPSSTISLSLSRTSTTAPGVFSVSGKVTSGGFAGGTFSYSTSASSTTGDCVTTPLTAADVNGTFSA